MILNRAKHPETIDRYLPVLLHGLGWLAYVLAVYNGNSSRYNLGEFFLHYGPKFLLQSIVFYINYFYFISVLLGKLKVLHYIAVNLLIVLAASFCLSAATHQLILISFLNVAWFLVLAILIRFSTDWFRHKQLEKEKENQQLKTELSFLKAQVNPHFFFNSLNNLYALALKQAPETPGTILKIAKIMRYMLYETDVVRVLLKLEVEMMDNYISLQQLKNKSGKYNPMMIIGDMDSIQIEPLLFLPLVENAFKHGTEPIHMELQVSPLTIQLKTINKIRNRSEKIMGGIGLINLKRRLALLYPGTHRLELQEKDDTFTASLTLNLQSE